LPSLSLTTALLGSGLSCAVLCYVMAHLRRLPDAPSVFGWWSLAFALGTLRFVWRSLQPWIGLAPALFGAEALQAAAAILLLMGVGGLLGFRPGRPILGAGLAIVVAWAAIFVFIRFDLVLLSVPLHVLAGAALSATAIALFREHRRRPELNLNIAAPPFAAWGLVEFLYPLTLANPWLVPWYFLLTQALAILISVGLIVGALRRFQDESRRAEERLATAFETMPARLALFDAGGDLVRGNAAYHSDFGPESQNVPRPNLRFEDLMQRLSRQRAAQPVETDESPPTAAPNAEIEFESTMPDGRTLMVRKASVPDGGSLLVAVDISAQIERERDLLQSARLLRATLDIAPIGIAAFAADGKIVAWNRRFVETIEFVATPPDAETTLNGVIGTLAHRGDLGSGAAPWDLASRAIAAGVVERDAEIDLALPSGRGAHLLWHALGDGGTLLCTLPTATPLTRAGA
jgi:PAS domain-containing protein